MLVEQRGTVDACCNCSLYEDMPGFAIFAQGQHGLRIFLKGLIGNAEMIDTHTERLGSGRPHALMEKD